MTHVKTSIHTQAFLNNELVRLTPYCTIIFLILVFWGHSIDAQTLTATKIEDAGTVKDWSIGSGGAFGDDLDIREPEQGNQLWLKFNDLTHTVEFSHGMPNISLKGSIFGSRTGSASTQFSIFAATSSSNGSTFEMFGDNHGSRPGQLTIVASAAEKSNGGLIRFLRHHATENWQESMRIDKVGHVGIGTTSMGEANYRLYVADGIKTGRVKTEATLADYVFSDDYEIMPLEAVDTYVKENHHLPGVISQEEVDAQDGVELTAFTIQLQEKLEELYLHVIRLNEEVKSLKKEREVLQEKLEIHPIKP
ncbi:MAG: hypothetical protein AAFO96_07670 [Bacteroidota bacterium]